MSARMVRRTVPTAPALRKRAGDGQDGQARHAPYRKRNCRLRFDFSMTSLSVMVTKPEPQATPKVLSWKGRWSS